MTPPAKMRPNMAKMRPKIAKIRPKMAKMKPKMAKMGPKIAKMRLKMAENEIKRKLRRSKRPRSCFCQSVSRSSRGLCGCMHAFWCFLAGFLQSKRRPLRHFGPSNFFFLDPLGTASRARYYLPKTTPTPITNYQSEDLTRPGPRAGEF